MNISSVYLAAILSFIIVQWGCQSGQKGLDKSQVSTGSDMAIAYNVLYDEEAGDYEVFTMNADGSDKRNITNLSGVEWTYFSSGDNLFFISDKDTCDRCFFLYSSDYHGDQLTKISDYRLADSWMSARNNGKELIVKPHSSVDSAFYIIRTDGSLVQRLYTGLPSAGDPLFVEGGNQVVFRGGTKKSKREKGYDEAIYRIHVDGSDLQKLTEHPPADTTAPWYAYKAGPPRWHPTEHFISYASFQNGKYSLYGVSLDGSNQWLLFDHPGWFVYHDWSADGNWLVSDHSDPVESRYDIALFDWKTKSMTILTDSTYTFQQAPNFVGKIEN